MPKYKFTSPVVIEIKLLLCDKYINDEISQRNNRAYLFYDFLKE